MDTKLLKKIAPFIYQLEPKGPMRVPGTIFSDEVLLKDMEDKVLDQIGNVATLPGIVGASMAMPDAHWGYGFPIGGVGAFDPEKGGVISAGGVGFDIACGVRTMLTGIHRQDIMDNRKTVADLLFKNIPAGLGSTGGIRISGREMDQMLTHGAAWAVKRGFGQKEDLEKIEEGGVARGAIPEFVSEKAKQRQEKEMGTLGSGNHYLEVQSIDEIFDKNAARAFGLRKDDAVISIHCGSRGLGHQVATDYMRLMVIEARNQKISLPDRDLACAPIHSDTGRQYLGAMRSAINCALANRQIITHLVREAFARIFPSAAMGLIYDVSHNTCREEYHEVNNKMINLFVHRKGATRSFGPGSPDLPEQYMDIGQPVLVGGSMGTSSYILVGTKKGMKLSFGSACHGAGRVMSRKQATKKFRASRLIDELHELGIEIRGHSFRGLAEEAPEAYKDVNRVIQVSHDTGLARKVARLTPMISVKG
jgi:tRNA-splicing ligase RtcB (3'-phosphate/5'-hydroxy nucleic acid ligase)